MMKTQIKLSKILQDYFYKRLINQRNSSEKTISSYRDTFRLLLTFAKNKLGKKIENLQLSDIDACLVIEFLNFLEKERMNSIRTRNTRLAAIRSLLRYASLLDPATLPETQQVLAIPLKRFDRPLIGHLTREEIDAIIKAPDTNTWNGQRDQLLFATLYNTGARVSEIIRVRCNDVDIGQARSILLHGKGRKERVIPLWKNTVSMLRGWIKRNDLKAGDILFPNRFGNMLSRSGVESRLKLAVENAKNKYSSLKNKSVSPHIIRHTTAMHMLQSGVDLTVIALWLGHESTTTTHHYVEANLAMKEKALESLKEPSVSSIKYRPTDDVLDFLNSL